MQHPDGIASRTPINQVPQLPFDRSVQFGNGARSNGLKAFPFFYNFVKYPYQEGIQNDTTGIYSIVGESAEGPDGILIPAGGMLNIPIIMQDDFPFHLLYLKYGAHFDLSYSGQSYNDDGAIAIPFPLSGYLPPIGTQIQFTALGAALLEHLSLGVRYYIVEAPTETLGFGLSLTSGGALIDSDGDTGSFTYLIMNPPFGITRQQGSREYLSWDPSGGDTLLNAHRNSRIPYWTELDVSLYFPSSGGRDLYGGFQRAPQLGATEEQPLPILDLQGTQDGHASIRTPYQLPASAHVDIRIRSRSIYPLRVYGHLFGYKITI